MEKYISDVRILRLELAHALIQRNRLARILQMQHAE
jgi:hypothetical protein